MADDLLLSGERDEIDAENERTGARGEARLRSSQIMTAAEEEEEACLPDRGIRVRLRPLPFT